MIEEPMKGAVQYNHKLSKIPVVNAGAKERIGFIDAPEMGPRKNTSNATIPPTTALTITTCTFLTESISKIPPIKNTVARISIPNIIGKEY